MNATGAIRAMIVADSPANTLLSGRIYTDRISVGQTLPYAVIQHISTRPNATKTGASEVDFCRVQIDVYGSSAAQADSVFEAIRSAIDYTSETAVTVDGTTVNVGRIDLENYYGGLVPETENYRRTADYSVYAKN